MRSQETQLENLMHKVGSLSKMRESSRPIVVPSYGLGERWGTFHVKIYCCLCRLGCLIHQTKDQ